ncbi:hypothetical protein [Brevibacillus laterosporus]|uniref:Uncharacterized protein n=1 Tax=Brevibacillus laterosporus TaxID=1465 RepID=A0AAP3DII3_BRELA|nr:hypothetical protein [Brevibacillus laterosporus]MCR8981608.1 hypothetical protein [Brevibacillus laterosporus]MCZ0808763.1 hypothetical protein [Brevibacillus laterosporus]MCZ0827264.1 hypothetical protein [Brevibacillus laterosporus]MCZ0851020.1 hypothetical protein [Brevibacillus laterosporus]
MPRQLDEELVDYCEQCGEGIYKEKIVWKLGANLFCKTQCLLGYLGAEEIRAEDI